MQRLRHAAFLVRLVLAWFVVSIGVAVAAPVIKPQSIELICSGGAAMKLLVKDADGNAAGAGVTLDCPLCASVDTPPPPVAVAPAVPPSDVMPQPVAAARLAAIAGAPLPARGPPASEAA